MRIALDLTSLLPEPTGVDVYQESLVRSLARVDTANTYRLFVNFEDRGRFEGALGPRIEVIPRAWRSRAARLAFQQVWLPIEARQWGADVVHSPSFIQPLWRGRTRHVLSVHDMTSFTFPELHIRLRRSGAYRAAVAASLRRADAVLVPSQATADAILSEVAGVPRDRLVVTPYGVADEFRPADPALVARVRQRLGLPSGYILHVGTLEPRKNLSRLVEAYRRLRLAGRAPSALVLAGRPGWHHESLLALLSDPVLVGAVHLTGYVSRDDLPALYSGARLFVYPSLYEGFGFPPLEAMACGVATISSRNSSLEENLAGAATLVAPADVDGLTQAMDMLLHDEAARAASVAAGLARASRFRWETTARLTLAAYARVSGAGTAESTSMRGVA